MICEPCETVCGTATIDPAQDVLAGSFGTWRLTWRAGTAGLAVGGGLRVSTDSDTDWGVPQFLDPAAPDYMAAETPPGTHAVLRTEGVKAVTLIIHGQPLRPGQTVTLIYGDRRGGSPGSRAQTFAEPRRHFRIKVDRKGNGFWDEMADAPAVAVVGGEPCCLVLIAPSEVVVAEAFRLLVKVEDAWGNASHAFAGRVELHADGISLPQDEVAFHPENHGLQCIDGLTAATPGVSRINAQVSGGGLAATSNPVLVTESATKYRLHWADPHGGQVASNTKIADFFRHARDVAAVQFVGYQRNADCISPVDWRVQQAAEREFSEPGRFVPIPGFEWSGRTWDGGHHNVYFRRHGRPVRRNRPAEVAESVDAATELAHIRDVYAAYRGSDTILTPHVGGEHSKLAWHDPTLEPAVEITSSHGTFEWMLRDALSRGYRLGFLGGSDSYTGRPGDDRPGHQLRRYAKAGLTGIYARDVSLDAFFEALRARRVYATTGARMILRFACDGHVLGSEYATGRPPRIALAVEAAAPLEAVEVFRGLQLVQRVPLDTSASSRNRVSDEPVRQRIRVLWTGASRMTSYSGIVWDGRLKLSHGRIAAVELLRFDSPRSHVVDQSDRHLAWHAWGCGYRQALVLELEDAEDADLSLAVATQTITGPSFGGHGDDPPRRISFAPAERAALSVPLRDLRAHPIEADLGTHDRRLTVCRAPEPGPLTAVFKFVDRRIEPGVNAYWMRVIQCNQEMGWTSPVFVDYSEA